MYVDAYGIRATNSSQGHTGMRRIRIATGVGIVLVALSTLVCADTLVLRDGTHVEGTVVSMTA